MNSEPTTQAEKAKAYEDLVDHMKQRGWEERDGKIVNDELESAGAIGTGALDSWESAIMSCINVASET